MAAYLLFALVMLTIGSRGGRIMASLVIIAISGALFATEFGPREQYNVISVARCIVGFFVGYALFDLWRWRNIQSAKTATIIEAIAVLGLILSLHARFDGPAYFLNYPLVALVVWAFASGKGALSKVIANPVLLWLGKVSFSLYMSHVVIRIYITQASYAAERLTGAQYFHWFDKPFSDEPVRLITLGSAWANDLMLVGYLVAVFVSAALLYRFVEAPTRQSTALLAKRLASAPEGAYSPARLWEIVVTRRKGAR